MIKRIIFDLDNTLIMWKDEYEKAADIALNVINYPKTNDLYKKINEVESEYEEGKTKFDQKEVIDYLNEKLNLHLPYEFMDIWLENIGMIAVPKEYPKEDFETLAYLSKKYELVILTNWFIETRSHLPYLRNQCAGEYEPETGTEAFSTGQDAVCRSADGGRGRRYQRMIITAPA